MKWRIRFSRQAYEFSQKHKIYNEVIKSVTMFIDAMVKNISPMVDVRKLKGKHAKHYRIRLRKYRIVFQPDNENLILHIARIDFRNRVYRKK